MEDHHRPPCQRQLFEAASSHCPWTDQCPPPTTIIILVLIIIVVTLNSTDKNYVGLGGSPGLVVMGGDSRPKGRGFESRRRILDGHDIFHIDLL